MKSAHFFLGLVLSSQVMAEAVPGQQLLSYFSANCRTQGEWTRAALADSTALIESLKSIAQDPDCRSVSGAIAQLGLMNQQLLNLDQVNDTQAKIAELDAQEQELFVHLSSTSDPATVSEINANLRNLQVTRAGLIGREKASKEMMGPAKVEALSSVVQIANSAFGQIVGNQKCLQKNPSVLSAATGILASVGATASVINPAVGLGLTAGASFLGETIEGLRKRYSNRSIRKLSDMTIAQEAFKCALETMSERWCQMRDAETFLDYKAAQRGKPIADNKLGTAIRLNDREIPVLLEWLGKIRSGVTPTTTSDANTQATVFLRESMVRSSLSGGVGLIEENRSIYNSYAEDLDERWVFLRGIIVNLTMNTQVPGLPKSPLFDVLVPEYAPYFLLGVPDDASIRDPNGNYKHITIWEKPAGFNPTLELVKDNYLKWVDKAQIRVNQELSRVLQPDPLQTLSSAFDRTENRWKISPMDALKSIITFLEMTDTEEEDFIYKRLYADTLTKLKEIYRKTQDAVIQEQLDGTPVEEIYEIAQLKYGTVVIQTRLDMIVRLSLLELLRQTPESDQVLVAQLLAAERFTETISKMSGTDNLALIRADINRAQPITIANLNSFIDTFDDNINSILSRLQKEERFASGTIAKAKRYARTELCFLLLSVPKAESYVDLRLCEGLKFSSIAPGGPETITLNRDMFRKDLNQRACVYREFFRQSKIFENWGIK